MRVGHIRKTTKVSLADLHTQHTNYLAALEATRTANKRLREVKEVYNKLLKRAAAITVKTFITEIM